MLEVIRSRKGAATVNYIAFVEGFRDATKYGNMTGIDPNFNQLASIHSCQQAKPSLDFPIRKMRSLAFGGVESASDQYRIDAE